ncbi:PREDICTED: uncharacterized protein LOC106812625 [Priapulus caudatus]|uniref:Uncharacterized protein LOC106812625 n=1 Tax=Priapulus caudatus TaxID=37621 RepID=A0ABM1EIK8_PRICU|nr:PREDICTED: uncharacterized protein LOC106812625 [Priapulus caudatus]
MTRLRPGVTALTRLSPAALKTHNSSTFQEDLLRLIDPDLMLPDQDKENKVRSSPDRRQLLQRTVSDESVHRSATLQQNRPAFPPDVLFTSAKPAHVSGALMSKESRLSPRALTALPSGGKTGRSARNGGKGILPLPDDGDGAGLDWNNLVETATKAIQSNVSPALATDAKQDEIPTRDLPQPRQQDYDVQRPLQDFDAQRPLQDYDTQRPLQDYDAQHPLKDYDVQRPLQDYDVQRPLQDYDVQHPVLDYDAQQRIPEYSAQQQQQQLPLQEYSAQQRPLQDYDAQRSRQGYEAESRQAVAALSSAPQDLLASGRLSSSPVYTSGPWRPTSTNPTQRQHELELRVAQLQQELNKERQERAEREAEIQQLQQDNVRLQEESQTAAAQLRKFTEWFFNTIDRQ